MNGPSEDHSAAQVITEAVGLLKQAKWQEAKTAHQRLIDLNINKAAGFYGLGIVYLMTKDAKRAKESFKSCIENDPSNANAYYNLGLIFEQEKTVEAARGYFLKAVKCDSNHHEALQKLRLLPSLSPADTSEFTTAQPSLMNGFYGLLEQDVQSKSHSAAISQSALSLMDGVRIIDRVPYKSAFLGQILGLLFMPLILLLAVVFPLFGSLPRPAERLVVLLIFAIFAFFCILGMVSVVLKVRNTRYTIDQGRLVIRSGIVARERGNHELYRVHDLGISQSFLNRLTKDGTLWLKIDEAGTIRLRGLAKYDDLQSVMERLRNLVFVLRMHPHVKGIVR